MSLSDIASRIDESLERAGEVAEERREQIIESDSSKMAHHIIAYVLERAEAGHDPYELGATMVQGAVIGEDESGGFLARPVIDFLESVLEGARDVIGERQGEEPIYHDPVAHAVQYFLAHNKFPASASPGVISKARAALAAGQRGKPGAGGAALGLYGPRK